MARLGKDQLARFNALWDELQKLRQSNYEENGDRIYEIANELMKLDARMVIERLWELENRQDADS